MVRIKLIFLLLAIGFSGLDAKVWSQNERLDMEFDNISMVQLFERLQKSTNLRFVFNHEDVERFKVSGKMDSKTISEILDEVFSDKPLKYEMTDEHVIVYYSKLMQKNAKGHKITGKVMDDAKEPLPGVTVLIKGTTLGTATNVDGEFSIEIPANGSQILVFSFIGMEDYELEVRSDKDTYEITMFYTSTALDEVVATGYFTMTKESFTGSARTFSAEDIQRAGNQNILSSLQNLDPSFMRIENNLMGSNPNVVPDYKIRGSSSIFGLENEYTSNPNMPVFIVDGFETTAEKVFDMDNNRVASITLLKDAAATAIYGARASNGVVVITTKSPMPGQMNVSYNMDASFYIADLSDYNLTNAEEKLALEKAAGMYTSGGPSNQTTLDKLYDERYRNILEGVNTYWLDKPLDAVAVGTKHSIKLDGGSEAIRYSLDLNYNNTPGVMKKSNRKRFGLAMSMQYIVKNITFKNTVEYLDVRSNNSPYGTFDKYAELNQYVRYKDDNGNYIMLVDKDNRPTGSTNTAKNFYNPLYNSRLNSTDTEYYNDFTDKFGLDWNIMDELRLRGNFSFTQKKTESDIFKPAKHTDFAEYTGDDFDRRGSYTASRGKNFTYEANIILTSFLQRNLHVLNSNLGWNIQEEKIKTFTVAAEGFPNENLDYISFATQYAKSQTPSGNEYTSRLMGFFGAFNYSFDERYLSDFSFRIDGSSKFGSKDRWAKLWSIGAGWNVHKEKFMTDIYFLNRLKLSATYGMTGSQNYDPYQAMTIYKYLSGERYHNAIGTEVVAFGNENLSWQRTFKQNYSLDLNAFNNRLNLTFEYFVGTSKDALVDVTLPPSLGFSSYKENLGEVKYDGYEFNLGLTLVKNNDFLWKVSVDGIHSKERLTKISNALTAYNEEQDAKVESNRSSNEPNKPKVRYVEGKSINTIWVNKSLGIDPATGYEIFLANNGDITTDWSVANYVPYGDTDPDLKGSMQTFFSYKGLQLNLIFQYSFGGKIYNQTLVDKVQDADLRGNVDRRVFTDRWQKPGDKVMYTKFMNYANLSSLTRPTSRFVEKNNYLELATINIAYEFNPEMLSSLRLKRLKVFFYMNDVFRASTVKRERGIEYPFARNFSVGLNANF